MQPQNALERCRSGRSGRTRNAVYGQLYRGFESLPFRQRAVVHYCSFFCAKREGFVSRWRFGRHVLRSVVVCYANHCACRTIVSENRFSLHCSTIPTISDCNNRPSVASQLLRPFESFSLFYAVR